jgi:hypothetical protein
MTIKRKTAVKRTGGSRETAEKKRKTKLPSRDVKLKPEPKNLLFPGRPNYKGPTEGLFGMLHHRQLFEYSDDVMTRVRYVRFNKPAHERPVRLRNMIYLGGLPAGRVAAEIIQNTAGNYWAVRQRQAWDNARTAALKALRPDILEYIRAKMPDTAWDTKNGVIKGTEQS